MMNALHAQAMRLYFRRMDERYLCYQILRERQYVPPEIWQAEHDHLLRRTLRQAYDNVPYYHRVLVDQGIRRREQIEAHTLTLLPVLTKEILRREFQSLTARDAASRGVVSNASGGSTGEPTRFLQDQEYDSWTGATKLLFDEWAGFQEGERRIRLWGSASDLFSGSTGRRRLGQFLMNERWLNAFDLRTAQLDHYIAQINAFRPVLVLGYADALYSLARYSLQHGKNLYSPRSVMSSAGNLFPQMRATIEQAFKTKVFNRYGSREVGDVASECSCGTMHLNTWTNHIEILGDTGQPVTVGETGRITVTQLANASMPLLRYDVGDLGALAPPRECGCGRSLPALQRLEGRTTDRFRMRDGSYVSAMALIHMIGVEIGSPEIEKFQVIQRSYDDYLVKILTEGGRPLSSGLEQRIQANLDAVLRSARPIEVQVVAELPPATSGKFRYTMSHLPDEASHVQNT